MVSPNRVVVVVQSVNRRNRAIVLAWTTRRRAAAASVPRLVRLLEGRNHAIVAILRFLDRLRESSSVSDDPIREFARFLDRLRDSSSVSHDPIRESARHDIRSDPRPATRDGIEKVVAIDVNRIRRRRVVRVQTPTVA